MNTVRYILKKLVINFLEQVIFRWRLRYENFYTFFNGQLRPDSKVLFYFPDPRLMHLGDQLFFEPVIRLFQENGFQVSVCPTQSMRKYFGNLNYHIIEPDQVVYEDWGLIISPSRFLEFSLLFSKRNRVFIKTEYDKIKHPLITDMLSKCMKMFRLKRSVNSKPVIPNFSLVKDTKDLIGKLIESPHKIVFFNNYINSGKFRLKASRTEKLEQYCLDYSQDFFVVHLGTLKDKIIDKKKYSFVDLDLRGRLSIDDLMAMLSLIKEFTYVGFDNVIMHISFILDADCKIASRGRWSESGRNFLSNSVDPPFSREEYLGLKEYIVKP
jgi:hypothetical protein